METIIRIEALNRVFKNGNETVHALRDINIDIHRGEMVILRGRSGSGKTTLINLMGGLDMPTSGSITIDGTDITKLNEASRDAMRRKQLGFVFQSVALLPNMTAFENVEFALRLAKTAPKTRRARVTECMTFVGLGKRMQHFPSELSGGEQQRVAIARGVAHKPQVLYADEPTAEVDSAMGLQIMMMFKNLVRQEGITIIMTTHDPTMMDLADHVITLQDGVVTEDFLINEAQQQFDAPKNGGAQA